MRNDALDELDQMPSLSSGTRNSDHFAQEPTGTGAEPAIGHSPVMAQAPKAASTGPLWALLGAALIALGGLGWWSFQQISLMEQQLVATQESFARISEDAAGRLQDISGKVVATESSVTGENQALKLRVKQLESKLTELSKQQQTASTQQGSQTKRLEQLSGELKLQADGATQLDSKLKGLGAEQAGLKAAMAEQGKLDARLKSLAADFDDLRKQGDPNQAVARLEQDLLVLRSELDNRQQPQSNTAEFDAFRGQVTRNVSTLQSQVQNLQQQLNNR
ncbi:MAG: ATPase [Pseudomonas sp.]|nr:ATPase [Pseudomonas sp.]